MKRLYVVISIVILSTLILSGCSSDFPDSVFDDINGELNGKSVVVRTFEEDGAIVDQINAKSVSIDTKDKFATGDSDGPHPNNSDIISMTIAGKTAVHAGGFMVIAENGLEDVFATYKNGTSIPNMDSSTPILNTVVNSTKNSGGSQNMTLLIRSQSGKPLAVYMGDISYFSRGISKSAAFIINGKFLLVYRCDYALYETSLLK